MSGKVNSTGAVSGKIGTTVGTPSGGKIKSHWYKTTTITSATHYTFSESWAEITYGNNEFKITGITATENNILHISANLGSVRQVNVDGYLTNVGYRIDSTDIHCAHVLSNLGNTHEVMACYQMTFVVPASFTSKTIEARGCTQGAGTGQDYARCRNDGMPHSRIDVGINIYEVEA